MKFQSFSVFYKSLNEGGAAGHMMHLYDDKDLTFGQLKKILTDVFEGKVKLTSKLDGQNISVTWKDGKIGLARNKATIREPMSIQQTAQKFEGRGELKKAFVNSLIDIEQALAKIPEEDLNRWFENGKNFLSVEVIYPPTKNVIDYDNRSLLVLHGIMTYDDKQNQLGLDTELGEEIFEYLKNADALNQEHFEIQGPQVVDVNNAIDANDVIKDTIANIDDFEKENDLEDSNTIQDFLDKQVNPEEKMTKAHREKIQKEALAPLELIVLKASAKFLTKIIPFVTTNYDKKVRDLQSELKMTLKKLDSDETLTDNERARVIKNLERLEQIGLDKIVPAEGIVFKYKDKVYKLSGAFAPLNQILGILKYR